MKTVKSTRITCSLDGLVFGWWDAEKEQFIPIKSQDIGETERAVMGCSETLLEALIMLTESIKDTVGLDLRQIWRRLDEAGV